MKPTLAEVAKEAGVSQAAVSMVLRDLPQATRFNELTRERIKQTAVRLGYRTNFFASQLRQSSSKFCMLYVKSLQDTYSASIAEAFQKRALERQYWTMISVSAATPDDEVIDRRVIGSHGISSIGLISRAADQVSPALIETLLKDGVSVLFIGRSHPNKKVSQVAADDYAGGLKLAQHVVSRGARTSLILAGSSDRNAGRNRRVRGFLDGMSQNGLPAPKVINCRPHDVPDEIAKEAFEQARRYLRGPDHADVIFATTDIRAFGVLQAVYDRGLTPGRDVGVVGYDDIWQSAYQSPPLTTVHQPTDELGASAADLMVDVAEGRRPAGESVVVEPRLVVRGSCRIERAS